MDDPDVPAEVRPERNFDHWVLFDIPPATLGISEGGSIGTKGANGRGAPAYAGPCPPPQYAPSEHRYFFRLYALDTMLNLPEGATKQQVLEAMEGHVIAQAELMGRYERAKTE
jgi:Raf kinase inhibitor-like YbhB/YbcL family protein